MFLHVNGQDRDTCSFLVGSIIVAPSVFLSRPSQGSLSLSKGEEVGGRGLVASMSEIMCL